MKIVEQNDEKNVLKLKFDSNQEAFLFALKSYLAQHKDCDIVGVYKGHYLIDESEIVIKSAKGSPKKILSSALKQMKKDLQSLKLK